MCSRCAGRCASGAIRGVLGMVGRGVGGIGTICYDDGNCEDGGIVGGGGSGCGAGGCC